MSRPIAVDTTIPPLEPVDAVTRSAAARADAVVADAWAAHHDEVFAFLVRSTRDTEAAEDLLQETFLRLLREARAGRTPDNVRAWLYRVAANCAVSRGRRLQTAIRWLAGGGRRAAQPGTEDPPEAGVIAREARADLVGALGVLRPDARSALLLAAEGFTGAEIAAAIGRSEAATRTLMCRARLQVRSGLARAEVVP